MHLQTRPPNFVIVRCHGQTACSLKMLIVLEGTLFGEDDDRMKGKIPLICGSLLCFLALVVIILAKMKRDAQQPSTNTATHDPTIASRERNNGMLRQHTTLERVRQVAQTKMPHMNFSNHEQTVFAEINPQIDELAIMELLLAIETEFSIDIPASAINERVGSPHRRDLRNHLSLALIAELLCDAAPALEH